MSSCDIEIQITNTALIVPWKGYNGVRWRNKHIPGCGHVTTELQNHRDFLLCLVSNKGKANQPFMACARKFRRNHC